MTEATGAGVGTRYYVSFNGVHVWEFERNGLSVQADEHGVDIVDCDEVITSLSSSQIDALIDTLVLAKEQVGQ